MIVYNMMRKYIFLILCIMLLASSLFINNVGAKEYLSEWDWSINVYEDNQIYYQTPPSLRLEQNISKPIDKRADLHKNITLKENFIMEFWLKLPIVPNAKLCIGFGNKISPEESMYESYSAFSLSRNNISYDLIDVQYIELVNSALAKWYNTTLSVVNNTNWIKIAISRNTQEGYFQLQSEITNINITYVNNTEFRYIKIFTYLDWITSYNCYIDDVDIAIEKPIKIFEEEQAREDYILKIFYPYVIIGIICAATALIVIGVYRKRKGEKKEEKIEKVTVEEVRPINVQCPYCQTTFQITPTKRPFKVKCPSCKKVSILR